MCDAVCGPEHPSAEALNHRLPSSPRASAKAETLMSSVYCPKTADLFLLDWLNVFLSLRQAHGLHLQVQSPCREFLISLLFSPGACSAKAECTMSQRFSETALFSASLPPGLFRAEEHRESVFFEYRVSVLLSGSLRKHPDICLVLWRPVSGQCCPVIYSTLLTLNDFPY